MNGLLFAALPIFGMLACLFVGFILLASEANSGERLAYVAFGVGVVWLIGSGAVLWPKPSMAGIAPSQQVARSHTSQPRFSPPQNAAYVPAYAYRGAYAYPGAGHYGYAPYYGQYGYPGYPSFGQYQQYSGQYRPSFAHYAYAAPYGYYPQPAYRPYGF